MSMTKNPEIEVLWGGQWIKPTRWIKHPHKPGYIVAEVIDRKGKIIMTPFNWRGHRKSAP